MTATISTTPPVRTFLGDTFELTNVESVKPFYENLVERPIDTLEEFRKEARDITTTKNVYSKKIETIKQSLIQDFSINKPKIAVLGLNPHCGDGGVIGKEDDLILKPVLKKIFDSGTLVFGPFYR